MLKPILVTHIEVAEGAEVQLLASPYPQYATANLRVFQPSLQHAVGIQLTQWQLMELVADLQDYLARAAVARELFLHGWYKEDWD